MIQPKQNFKATESFAASSFTHSVRLRYGLIFLMLFSKLFISQETFFCENQSTKEGCEMQPIYIENTKTNPER